MFQNHSVKTKRFVVYIPQIRDFFLLGRVTGTKTQADFKIGGKLQR